MHALPALAAHRAAIYSLPPGPSAFKWSPQPSSSASLPIFASVSEGRVVLLSFSSGSEWTESEAWIAALAHQCCAFFGGLVRTRCSEDLGTKTAVLFAVGSGRSGVSKTMLLARANAALREVGLCSRNRLSPRIGLRCLAPLATASSTTSELGHDDQANFSRSNSSVPSEWIPPKIGDTTNQRDWIVPGVHVLWDDVSQMRLRRRTKLLWTSAPRTVLLVKKCSDERVTAQMLEIATWLTARGVRVLVEENVQVEMPDYDSFSAETGLPRPDFAGAEDSVVKHITVAPSALLTDDRHSATVTLGGDGTLLHLANLFNGDCEERSARPPPVVSFGMGTLGFLTPFDVANYKEILGCILRANSAPM